MASVIHLRFEEHPQDKNISAMVYKYIVWSTFKIRKRELRFWLLVLAKSTILNNFLWG